VVTLYDVARQAGVSIATVSRVLHGQEPVRESTRDRVRAAIKELGYVPDGAAQSLARSRKDVIGLVCVEHTGLNPNQYDIESMSLLFYDEVMRGVEALIRERHWSLLITYLREDENPGVAPQEDEPVLPRLQALSGKVDGLLIGEGVVPATALARLARRLPVVVVAGDAGMRGVDVVAAEVYPSMFKGQALPGEVKDATQVRLTADHFFRLDEAGKLGAAFGPAKGAAADVLADAEHEEGWVLGA